MSSKAKRKITPLEIGGLAVIFILLLAIISTFVLYGIFKDANTAPKLFGSRVYIMNSDSMEPRIKSGSAVFVTESLDTLKEGKVILCSIDGQLAVVGFVGTQDVAAADGSLQTRYLVKYDKGADNEVWGIGSEDIIGVATTYSSGFGGLVNFASSKVGMLLIVIIPCALLMAYEIVMLILAKAKKKDQDLSEAVTETDADEEIERLRREILESRKKKEPAEDIGGTKAFTAPTAKKQEAEKSVTDKTIQLRSAKPAVKPVPVDTVKDEPPMKLAFTSDSKPEPKIEPKQEPKAEEKPAVAIPDVTKMSSSDIDELIKMLEAEKHRLENK